VGLVALAIAVLPVLTWVRDEFLSPEKQARWKIPKVLPHWHWWVWVIVGLVTLIVIVVEFSYRTACKNDDVIAKLGGKLTDIENARPKLVFCGAEVNSVDLRDRGGRLVFTAPFIGAKFSNRPGNFFPNAIAKDVRGKISFYSAGKLILGPIDGRWSDSDQPMDMSKSRTQLLGADFGLEQNHALDIAFLDSSGKFYAWNNDSYPTIKHPRHDLGGDEISTVVRLVGPWVDETFRFTFSKSDNQIVISSDLS